MTTTMTTTTIVIIVIIIITIIVAILIITTILIMTIKHISYKAMEFHRPVLLAYKRYLMDCDRKFLNMTFILILIRNLTRRSDIHTKASHDNGKLIIR